MRQVLHWKPNASRRFPQISSAGTHGLFGASEIGTSDAPPTFAIAEGQTTGTFTIIPSTLGNRTIALDSTSPALTISGSPITYNAIAAPLTSTGSCLLMGL